MTPSTTRFLRIAFLCLIASITASLLMVWAISKVSGFDFSPSVVAVPSAVICSVGIAKAMSGQQTQD